MLTIDFKLFRGHHTASNVHEIARLLADRDVVFVEYVTRQSELGFITNYLNAVRTPEGAAKLKDEHEPYTRTLWGMVAWELRGKNVRMYPVDRVINDDIFENEVTKLIAGQFIPDAFVSVLDDPSSRYDITTRGIMQDVQVIIERDELVKSQISEYWSLFEKSPTFKPIREHGHIKAALVCGLLHQVAKPFEINEIGLHSSDVVYASYGDTIVQGYLERFLHDILASGGKPPSKKSIDYFWCQFLLVTLNLPTENVDQQDYKSKTGLIDDVIMERKSTVSTDSITKMAGIETYDAEYLSHEFDRLRRQVLDTLK